MVHSEYSQHVVNRSCELVRLKNTGEVLIIVMVCIISQVTAKQLWHYRAVQVECLTKVLQ